MKTFPRASDIAKNPNKDNSKYSLQLNRWLLKPVGAWPTAIQTRVEKNLSRVQIFVCYSVMSTSLVFCFLNIMYKSEDTDRKLQAIGTMFYWLTGAINYSLLLLHGSDILVCVEHVEADWLIVEASEHRRIMLRHAEMGRFMIGFCATFMHSSVLAYSVTAALETEATVIGNETLFLRLLPFPFYDEFVDPRFSPAYEVVFGTQLATGFIVNSATVGASGLAAAFAMHACGQLKVLVSRLNHLVGEEGDFYLSEKRLAAIVEHHVRVLRFVGRIEVVTHQVCFVGVVGGTFEMCLLGYFIVTGWDNMDKKDMTKNTVVYISLIFNIFILCYIGEIITEECERISEVAYMTEWHRLPPKIVLGLTLIICRSNIIPKITAGKVFQLSIVSFGDAIRTSAVYLNMLRTMTSSVTVDV